MKWPKIGRCLENVKAFVDKYQKNAQALADMLGNGVTAAEVLALSGNETSYGTSAFVKFGNFFGLHGHGPAGTYYTTGNKTPVMKFPVENGFLASGQVYVNNVKQYVTPGIGDDPLKFFTLMNLHGYATGNPACTRFPNTERKAASESRS